MPAPPELPLLGGAVSEWLRGVVGVVDPDASLLPSVRFAVESAVLSALASPGAPLADVLLFGSVQRRGASKKTNEGGEGGESVDPTDDRRVSRGDQRAHRGGLAPNAAAAEASGSSAAGTDASSSKSPGEGSGGDGGRRQHAIRSAVSPTSPSAPTPTGGGPSTTPSRSGFSARNWTWSTSRSRLWTPRITSPRFTAPRGTRGARRPWTSARFRESDRHRHRTGAGGVLPSPRSGWWRWCSSPPSWAGWSDGRVRRRLDPAASTSSSRRLLNPAWRRDVREPRGGDGRRGGGRGGAARAEDDARARAERVASAANDGDDVSPVSSVREARMRLMNSIDRGTFELGSNGDGLDRVVMASVGVRSGRMSGRDRPSRACAMRHGGHRRMARRRRGDPRGAPRVTSRGGVGVDLGRLPRDLVISNETTRRRRRRRRTRVPRPGWGVESRPRCGLVQACTRSGCWTAGTRRRSRPIPIPRSRPRPWCSSTGSWAARRTGTRSRRRWRPSGGAWPWTCRVTDIAIRSLRRGPTRRADDETPEGLASKPSPRLSRC